MPEGLQSDRQKVSLQIGAAARAGRNSGSGSRRPNLVERGLKSAAVRDRPAASLWEICETPTADVL